MPPARVLLWLSSVGAATVLVRTLWVGPLPTWLAIVAFAAYSALCTLGWVFPHLEMYGDVFWRGNPGRKAVALTFDDGPHPVTTRQVLDLLERRGHRATFFLVGAKVAAHGDVVRDIRKGGHSLGVHGFVHDRLYSFKAAPDIVDDIRRAQTEIASACGVTPILFRPPIGHVSPRVAAAADKTGVVTVGWSVRALDGLRSATRESVTKRVRRGLRDGAIILLHDAAEHDDRVPAGVQALADILDAIEASGLRTVTVEEMLHDTLANSDPDVTASK